MQKNIFMKNLGLYVKMERLREGLSQEELASNSECGLSLIGTLERGEKSVSFYNLYKIAKCLNIDINKMLVNIENKAI